MFDNQCTACGKRQLIFPSQITSVSNTENGIFVAYTCWCGAAQTWLTGRATATRPAVAA
ncbi:MAG: hypothetical protein ACR2FG_15600 [Marmoricola sp.]